MFNQFERRWGAESPDAFEAEESIVKLRKHHEAPVAPTSFFRLVIVGWKHHQILAGGIQWLQKLIGVRAAAFDKLRDCRWNEKLPIRVLECRGLQKLKKKMSGFDHPTDSVPWEAKLFPNFRKKNYGQ